VDDPLQMYLADIYTIPVNLAGLPGISVPCGFPGGLPVGLQLIGKPFDETTVLRAAHAYEQTTEWHTRRPPIVEKRERGVPHADSGRSAGTRERETEKRGSARTRKRPSRKFRKTRTRK